VNAKISITSNFHTATAWIDLSRPDEGGKMRSLRTAMEEKIPRATALLFAAGLALFCTLSIGKGQAKDNSIKLNHEALEFAQNLIANQHVVVDKRTAWGEHRPSAEKENEFIRQYGLAEYAKWHLAIDESHRENTKARYKFPYGDFKNVHRCAVLGAKSRAAQHGYGEIGKAAAQLEEMIHTKVQGPLVSCNRD
jgi:hypothetical protein